MPEATLSTTSARSAHQHGEQRLAQRVDGAWQRVLGSRVAPRALDAAHHDLEIALIGRMGYYVDAHATGRPLVLIHGVHASASAFDVKPLFDAFRGERPVYAPDLPGFGTSERGANTYCPILYAKAIKRFLIDVVSPREEPVDVIALGLAGELVARVALEEPTLFRTIAMISPTGLERAQREVSGRRAARVERALRFPLWAAPAFRALTSRPSVKHFLKKHFAGSVPREYVDHAVRTSRASGAYFAPWAFVAGSLFTSDAFATLYEKLRVPTLVVHDAAPYADFGRLGDLVRRNPAVRTKHVEGTKGLPHFERKDEVIRAIRELHEETRRGEEAEARA